jgi:hypothetical protein
LIPPPPSSVMNSRRLMCSPEPEDRTLPQRCRKSRVVRHSKNCALMSQMGQKQTSRRPEAMSALLLKADIRVSSLMLRLRRQLVGKLRPLAFHHGPHLV